MNPKSKRNETQHGASVFQVLLEVRQAWSSPSTESLLELEAVLTFRVILGSRVQGRHQIMEKDCALGLGQE